MFFYFTPGELINDAIIIKLVSLWNEKVKIRPERTTIQKLCYFAEAIGVPLGYKFSVYKYGPYSQELFEKIDDMVMYGLLADECSENRQKDSASQYSITESSQEILATYSELLNTYEDNINSLVDCFKDMQLRELELVSTIHYYYTANNGYYRGIEKDYLKKLTIEKVVKAKKDRFKKKEIDNAYFELEKNDFVFC